MVLIVPGVISGYRDRQPEKDDQTRDHGHNRDDHSKDWTIDKKLRKHAALLLYLAFGLVGGDDGACSSVGSGATFTCTFTPGWTFWMPSTMTRSPACKPRSMIQRLPMRSVAVTVRDTTLSSSPTTSVCWTHFFV